ncbi:MAG: hypothetical protein WCV92_01270 [Candidatus Buchananbacteria bacterium]
MIKKLFNFFKKNTEGEEKKKMFSRGATVGIIIAIIIVVLILIFAWPGFFRKGASNGNTESPAKLKVTIITKKDCPECWDVSLFTNALSQYNVKISSTSTLYYDSGKGKDLVKKYKITKIPSLIIEGDLNRDANLQPFWQALGDIDGNTFIFRQVIPPYVDVASGQLRGRVQITYLTDSSCPKCYDVMLHENALKNLAVPTSDRRVIDISSAEGKALITKYGIKLAPTVLVSGEVSEYGNLADLWKQVGTVAKDGTYIFTNVELMGTYKDLSKNKIITPPVATSTPTQVK